MSQLLQIAPVDAGHLAEALYEHTPNLEVVVWALAFRKCKAVVAGVVLDGEGRLTLADELEGFVGYRAGYRLG